MYSIICLIGSTRFESEFRDLEKDLTLKGYLVFSPLVYNQTGECPECGIDVKNVLDIATKQKIKNSDIILVVDKDKYIGSSTKEQIEYAELLNKRVLYYSNGDVLRL